MMPSTTIIVPIYNGERFLARCLDSILRQTFADFELILVNDGSTDGSAALCRKYAAQDSRVRLIDKANEGVSKARNVGLDAARGQFLAFVDCDDWLEPSCLQTLMDGMAAGIDLSIGGYREVGVDGTVYKDSTALGLQLDMTATKATEHLFRTFDFFSFCYPWAKLFRREAIERHGLRFREDIAVGEDRLFIFDYLQHAHKAHCDSTATYNYMQNPAGAMRKGIDWRFITCFEGMEAMRRACRDTGVLRALNEECASMLMHTMGCGMEAGVRKALQGYARHYVLRPWTIRPRQWARLTALALFNVTL